MHIINIPDVMPPNFAPIVTVTFLSRVPLVNCMHTFDEVLIELLMVYSTLSKAMFTSGESKYIIL